MIVGKRKKNCLSSDGSSSCSSARISVNHMQTIIDRLMSQQTRKSTAKTYLSVWRQFNNFIIKLDRRPKLWEDRVTLFVGYLIDKGMQSATVKSYVSAIKRMLIDDKYKWKDENLALSSLTRACKLKNDILKVRLPIHCGFLEMILYEIHRIFNKKCQPYLCILYQALFALGYYGLMRVGELTQSPHVIKAKNVHLAKNKDKLLIILYSSKTHSEANRPQKIKITANRDNSFYAHRSFCPFKLLRAYLLMRGSYRSDREALFIFRDGNPILPEHARKLLRLAIDNLGLECANYDMHSLRIGRTSDLSKFNYSIEEVKRMGRWKSNAIYKYIRQ